MSSFREDRPPFKAAAVCLANRSKTSSLALGSLDSLAAELEAAEVALGVDEAVVFLDPFELEPRPESDRGVLVTFILTKGSRKTYD